MSIGREESLFLTVSEDHRQRAYPEYVQRMSAPFSRAGGMVAAYEGVLLGGADRISRVCSLVVPLMSAVYVLCSVLHLTAAQSAVCFSG